MNGLVLGWVCLQQTKDELKEIKWLLLYTILPWEIVNSFLQTEQLRQGMSPPKLPQIADEGSLL